MASKEGHVTLNFHPILLKRVRDYADKHGMKLNAVFKKAFELLEDHEFKKASGDEDVPN